MNNQIITITGTEADAPAEEFFIKISGLNKAGDKYTRMRRQGMEIRERIRNRITLRAIVSSFPGAAIKRNTASLRGISFECNAFQRLNPGHVRGIYAFILTAGHLEEDRDASILDQLYTDIWGTAYVDAGLTVLKQHVERDLFESAARNTNTDVTVLDYFGPGFYGMDINQIGSFFELLDGERIGVKAGSSGLMLPLKSCAGFFIAVDDGTELPASDCKSCRAEYKNCSFCHVMLKEERETAGSD